MGAILMPARMPFLNAGARTYKEAEPYQAELRLQAKAFLGALHQAGFSLDGIMNGMSEDQYIQALTAETSGIYAIVPHGTIDAQYGVPH